MGTLLAVDYDYNLWHNYRSYYRKVNKDFLHTIIYIILGLVRYISFCICVGYIYIN